MPNWKKLITSGSDAGFNSINVDTFVSASSFIGDGSGLTGVTSYTDTDTLAFLNSINALSGSALQSAIDTEKARIDAILLTADADKDSFVEIVSLINSIDTDNDTAFASFYTASNGRLGALELFTSSFEAKTLISESNQIIQLGFASTGSNTFIGYQEFDQGFESTIGDSTVSHFTYNNESGVPVEKVQLRAIGSGSYSEIYNNPTFVPGNISIEATSGSDSIAKLYADQIQIGAFGTSVNIGNQGSDIIVGGSTILLHGNTAVSGSVDITGSVTASHFVGDGSGLSGITVSEAATVSEEVTNITTTEVTHNFDSYNVIITAYDDNRKQVIPQSVTLTDLNTATVTFCDPFTGTLVVGKGGHIVSGVYVDDISTMSDTFTNVTTYTASHPFDTKNVYVTVYDSNDQQMIPQTVTTSTNSSVTLTFCEVSSGRVLIAKAGHVVSGSIPFENISNKPDLISGSVTGSNVVGSDTVTSIETITSASYAAITPVNGTLYIIVG